MTNLSNIELAKVFLRVECENSDVADAVYVAINNAAYGRANTAETALLRWIAKNWKGSDHAKLTADTLDRITANSG